MFIDDDGARELTGVGAEASSLTWVWKRSVFFLEPEGVGMFILLGTVGESEIKAGWKGGGGRDGGLKMMMMCAAMEETGDCRRPGGRLEMSRKLSGERIEMLREESCRRSKRL